MVTYTADGIREAVEKDRSRLLASFEEGRPSGWTVDQRTKDIVCISLWIREEMLRLQLDELGRKTQEGVFNRYSRSDDDLFTLAAEIMNDVLVGNIDRDRKTHRRWG